VSDNEKKLVKRILSGDEKAFEELFDALHSQVYNICLGFMKNPQDAKDMAQETFIKIYQKLHTFRFQCSLTTWIYSICASTCLDALRRQQRLITGELKESDATSTHVPEDALLLDELLEHIVYEIDKKMKKRQMY
jgi:RNA polymerase sigma factor (sigma-70 family)